MTRPIDEKIVAMKMDNSDFIAKANETTGIFGKLTEALNKIPGVNIGKTADDLGNIRREAGRTNLDALTNSVQAVASRFTVMGMVGVTALQNITNRAIDAGMAIAKNLSIDQVMGGFQEYELKMGSIQTILANTSRHGTTLDDVKKSLEDLNDYADKTIYSFGDMTKNIGLFTNAGLKLEESTSMIKGFSNAAAASGSNSEQASRAAYQLSQGLSQGYIMTQDWMSLTNAGMGNDNMKRDLIALGKAMGELDYSTNYTLNNWKEVLSDEKWLTTEVMSTYLQAMAGDMDKAALMTKGLTEAQADMLVQNAKTGEESAVTVRTFTQLMDTLAEGIGSGWAETFEHLFGDFEESTKLWTKLSETIGDWFQQSSDARNALVKDVADNGGFLNIFDGIQNAVIPLIQAVGAIGEGFKKAFPPKTAEQIVAMTQGFKAFTEGLKLSESTLSKLATISQGAFSIFSTLWVIAKHLGETLMSLIPEGIGGGLLDILVKLANFAIAMNESVKAGNFLTDAIDKLGEGLRYIGQHTKEAIGHVMDFAGSIRGYLTTAIDWLGKKLAPVADWFREAFGGGIGADEILGGGVLAALFLIGGKVVMFIEDFRDRFGDFKFAFNAMGGMFDGVGDALNAFVAQVRYDNLLKIAISVGILALALKLMESIKTEDLTKGIAALATSLGVMMGGLMLIDKFSIVGGMRASINLIAMATAVMIMAGALRVVAGLKPEELKTGLQALVGIMATMTASLAIMSKVGGKLGTSSLQLVALATAVLILTVALKRLSEMEPGDLKKSVATMGILLLELAVFVKIANKSKLGPGTALGIVAITGALLILIEGMRQINTLNKDELIKGLGTIAILLVQIGLFAKLAGGGSMIAAGVGIMLIAGALVAMMGPIQTLAGMSYEELAKGLGAMAIALLAVAGAGILATGAIGGAVAITIIALALNLLMIPILAFAAMSWETLIKSLVGLGLSLAVIAGVAMLLTPAIPSMLGFGAAIVLMGAGMLLAGVGISLFGAGLAALATITATSIAAIVGALVLLIQGLNEIIPATIEFVVNMGFALVDGLNLLAPKVADGAMKLIIAVLVAITNHLPKFLEVGGKLIVQLIEGIGMLVPLLVDAGMKAIIQLVEGLATAVEANGPQLISAVMRLLGEIIILVVEAGTQMVNALFGWIPGVQDATKKIGETAETYIRDNFGAYEVGVEKGTEFDTGLKEAKPKAEATGKELGESAMLGAQSVDLTSAGAKAGDQFASGIASKKKVVADSTGILTGSVVTSITKNMDINSPAKVTYELGEDTGDGYADGLNSKKKKAGKSAKGVTDATGKAMKKGTDAIKKAFKADMDDADYKFKMGELDEAGYTKELNNIKRKYSKRVDLVKEVNLKIKKVEEGAVKDREKLRKDEFNRFKGDIDDKKYYNQLSIKQELDIWTRAQKDYAAGSDERKQADREVYRLKNDINRKLIDLNDEYVGKMQEANKKLLEDEKALNDEYDNTLRERTNALTGFAGLFDEANFNMEKSGWTLMNNLKGQVEQFRAWTDNINLLEGRGIDTNLLGELRQMGPSMAGEIAALTHLADEELSEYAELWRTKNELARTQASSELEWMRLDTDESITKLREETAVQLDEYQKEWVSKISEIKTGVVGEYVGLNDDMKTIGKNTVRGLMTGLTDMTPALMAQANAIANQIRATIQSALQINSPSKITTWMGHMLGEGLIVGMADSIKGVTSTAKTLAVSTKDSLNKFLDGFNMQGSDNEIHIKAVIDYESLDPSKLVKMDTMTLDLDTSYTRGAIGAARSSIVDRQSPNREASSTDNSRNFRPVTHIHAGDSAREIARANDRNMRRLAYEFGV